MNLHKQPEYIFGYCGSFWVLSCIGSISVSIIFSRSLHWNAVMSEKVFVFDFFSVVTVFKKNVNWNSHLKWWILFLKFCLLPCHVNILNLTIYLHWALLVSLGLFSLLISLLFLFLLSINKLSDHWTRVETWPSILLKAETGLESTLFHLLYWLCQWLLGKFSVGSFFNWISFMLPGAPQAASIFPNPPPCSATPRCWLLPWQPQPNV